MTAIKILFSVFILIIASCSEKASDADLEVTPSKEEKVALFKEEYIMAAKKVSVLN